MATIYSADNPPAPSTKVSTAWTTENVPVTDGSERQMGKDAFLTLLLTQLQNQDPMNPMENTEMTAQLAQFSQLEQLANMNTNLTNIAGYIMAQNQFQTLSMIGKDITAQSNGLSVTNGETDVHAGIDVSQTCDVKVYILNSNKEQVRMIDMGMVEAGSYDIDWDGKNTGGSQVPDGYYFFQVTATAADGTVLEDGVTPMVAGKVTKVSFDESGQPVVYMGHAPLSLSQVMEILNNGALDEMKEGEEG